MVKNKAQKNKKGIGGIMGNIIFYLLLASMLFVCVTMVKAKIDGRQPTILGYKFFSVLTGSMTPTIEVGDLVITKEVLPSEIKPNDIITFGSSNSDNITTHRVKDVLNENGDIKFITQGDANNVQDPLPVDSQLVIGKVVKFIPKVGAMMTWISKNLKNILVILVAGVIISLIGLGLKKKLNQIDTESN